ncbi:hypothetical protein TVAG_066020 [Trichomonas vaginalis G3]|uniref:Uncharacterized protein n=1 Tax=Trichomonas vaginalis (strain ATCC PRA-98 / G3) TaxID=412133 RepID=A2EM06_TRIV3|nr:hypothetical protein TVAGG3_0988990 [Trichomonas vaginalis G3]EAY06345.1 hypothetical protein TVAG_066020 [Trichomonas vaginalis G3]KAI5489885.1 hypothetical protein TVAGG3_0988990 [Trichomonas vaginalis G3]|eukprot:XP_001318568.1 hypothetical protein [Trichomonas vaginalis G3]
MSNPQEEEIIYNAQPADINLTPLDKPGVIRVGDPYIMPLDHPMPVVVSSNNDEEYQVPKMKIGFGPEVQQGNPQ